jgi:hypothetical protein
MYDVQLSYLQKLEEEWVLWIFITIWFKTSTFQVTKHNDT